MIIKLIFFLAFKLITKEWAWDVIGAEQQPNKHLSVHRSIQGNPDTALHPGIRHIAKNSKCKLNTVWH